MRSSFQDSFFFFPRILSKPRNFSVPLRVRSDKPRGWSSPGLSSLGPSPHPASLPPC